MGPATRAVQWTMITRCACALLAAAAMPVPAQGNPADSAGAWDGKGSMTLHLRSYYLDRHNPDAPNNKAATIGGWAGLDSGWFFDRVKFGAVAYTSQKVAAPADEDGTLLLKRDQKSFGGWGELNAKVKLWEGAQFTGYRHKVFQPEVNPQDNRMAPNTFEGYTLAGAWGGLEYFAGYLDKMKTRNATGFVNFARILNAPAKVDAGMWLGGLRYRPAKELTLRLSTYHVPDLLNSTYVDASWQAQVSKGIWLRLSGQYMYQSSAGDDALTGRSFSTSYRGLKADFHRGGTTLTGAYTQTGRGANYQNPFGDFPGYTFVLLTALNRANENGFLLRASHDFSAMRLPGLVLTGSILSGNSAINPANGAAVPDKTEYNITVDYRFHSGSWPDWIRPLSLRARATRVIAELGGSTSIARDYRFIVNFERVLNF
jgi:hypothetical protein